jgi:hypothetical protein
MPTERSTPRNSSGPEFRRVFTDDVLFDPSNPRLGGTSTTKQEKLQEILMDEPHLANLLVESFVVNGFIEYEPLVVSQNGKKYSVIEGNRRLAAVKHIRLNPQLYAATLIKKLEKVPVLVFHEAPDKAHRNDIRTYLGVRHLLGYREWPSESKAIFLDQNIKTKADFRRLKSEFSMGRNDIARFLIPFRVKKAASNLLEEYELGDDRHFWTLGEALQRAGIKEYIKLDVDRDSLKVRSFDKSKFEYLLEFLYGSNTEGKGGSSRAAGLRRITETRQLTRLAKVLANKRGSEKLENGSTLEEAELYVSSPEETIAALISDLRVTLQKIIQLKPSESQIKDIAHNFKNFEKAMTSL